MKKSISFKQLMLVLITALSIGLISTGCNKDDEEIGAVPSVTLNVNSASNTPGSTVSTKLTIAAPEGLKKLNIYKNGVAENSVSFNNEKTATYNFSYTIDASLAVGTIVNFTFEAVDSRDRESEIKVFQITVSAVPAKEIVEVPEGDITGSVTWTADKIWRLNGFVRIQDGGQVTIEPGTVVFGSRATKGTLVVQRGGKLIAEGTAAEPIVFTSERDPGSREPGDWGGVVLCGRAVNNQGADVELEGGYGGIHGGNNDNDNSGILKFVRIEYAGTPINPNQEVNSLTMGSVGSATTIENIQCSYGLDDSFEWFGGKVNGKYLVAYRGLDDDFDVDFGHSGFVQFALAIRGATLADQSGSNGFEVDNDGAGSSLTPFTESVFSNVTVIGPKKSKETAIQAQFQNAAQLRRNCKLSIYNSFMTAFPNGLFIDDSKPGASQNALDGSLQIRNMILAGVDGWGNNNWGANATNGFGPLKQVDASVAPGFEVNAWYATGDFNNQTLATWNEAGIDPSIFDTGTPKVTPNAGSPLLAAARWNNTPKAGSFFEQVSYSGAFGTTDWTEGWCNWNPQTKEYR